MEVGLKMDLDCKQWQGKMTDVTVKRGGREGGVLLRNVTLTYPARKE